LDERTAEITVRSLRPGAAGSEPPAAEKPPTDDDRQANNLVQSEDPRVVQLANEAAGDESDPTKVALALERHVGSSIRKVNFTQALATAADVARTGEGDCTEHAVLLAAMARAKGIPARVAIGLVYVEGLQGFGYHMWNELFLNDRWVPMDATLAHGGIGAGHLKLSHSSLAGGDAYSSFLPVARVLGRLTIEAME
jgi:transglutaminase-like putative cysteine protease